MPSRVVDEIVMQSKGNKSNSIFLMMFNVFSYVSNVLQYFHSLIPIVSSVVA